MDFTVGSMEVVVDEDRILLIKRIKFPYIGFWSIPSGRIEPGEHIEETAIREIKEETNIDADFEDLLGVVSEHLFEEGKLIGHFILFVCKLNPQHKNHQTMSEGDVRWFTFDEIERKKDMIIPSDYLMIKNVVLERKGRLFRSVVEKSGETYTQKAFEVIS